MRYKILCPLLAMIFCGVPIHKAFAERSNAEAAISSSHMGPAIPVNFAKQVYEALALPNFPTNAQIDLNFDITKDSLTRAEIQQSGVRLETEAACLEAFLAAGAAQWHILSDMKKFTFRLNSSNEFVKNDTSIAEFYRTHPNLSGNALVHLIPVTLNNAFSDKELRSVNNLASIGNDRQTALTSLQKIYQLWTPFLGTQKNYSREEIIAQAQKIKKAFKLREGSIPPGDIP